jgi:two-component system NtrC family sensor kinase
MPAPASISQTKPTVLLIGRSTDGDVALPSIFEAAGYHTVEANDAASALRIPHEQRCDLVVIDIETAPADTVVLCRLFRAQPLTSNTTMIALSENPDENYRLEILRTGIDDVIYKPFTPKELISRADSRLASAQREWILKDTNRELRFLADLGRSLLRAIDPDHLVKRLAGATFEATRAAACAAYLRLENGNLSCCVFDREGSAQDFSVLRSEQVEEWLQATGAAVPSVITQQKHFLLRDNHHVIEYACPLRVCGRTKGVLVVAYDHGDDCGETERRLTDAAAQQGSLAAHVTSLYHAARESSASLAEEVTNRTAETEAQRRFIEAIIDSLPVSLYAIDRTYRIVAWNRNRELGELGIPRGSVIGRNIFQVLTRQKREVLETEFARVFETGEIDRVEQETVTKNGETKHWLISKIPMWIDGGIQVSHVITVGEEITDRVEANRAVARAEKLAAVGRLASGVVHEINNPLATISACAEALESRLNEGAFASSPAVDDLREYLGLIRSEAFRCKTITNGLLDFSRSRASQQVPVNVSEIIDRAATLVSHQRRGERINVQVSSDANLLPVLGDPVQLQQAVIALATNAIDAMPFGGELKISARNDGRSVLIDVADSGIGIPPENLQKIFEPFFTTKEPGQGTGLGLAVCYGILTEHGGSLDVQSTVGVGTTFTISLPTANQDGDLAG